jgi:hypothetical protein
MNASFVRQLRSRHQAALNQPLKSMSLGQSWVIEFNPQRNWSTIAIGSV